jgi:predicted acyltransferase
MEKKRIVSIDALRGFDMLWIMGGAEFIIALAKWINQPWFNVIANQMDHVVWNGFHFYDIIFPLFLFLAGVSFPFSLQKRKSLNQSDRQIHSHIFTRMLILVALGILYNGFLSFEFPARYASVLGRIGIAWACGALIAMHVKRKYQYWIFIGILFLYWAILMLIPVPGVGAGILTPDKCIVGYVDRLLLPGKFYFKDYDPEGILSTLPAIGTALLGIFCGYHLNRKMNEYHKTAQLFIAGAILVAIGWLWNMVLPINKNIWTSSFAVFAGGWSIILLSIFYFLFDVLNWKKLAFPFVVIGLNSITIYLAQPILGLYTPHRFFFAGAAKYFPPQIQESYLTFTYIFVCWIFLYFLYKKKIFIKV